MAPTKDLIVAIRLKDNVIQATNTLNIAIQAAHSAGLAVSIRAEEFSQIGMEFSQPVVNAAVVLPLNTLQVDR